MPTREQNDLPAAEPPLGWFLRAIGRQWWIILICVFVAVGAAAAYSYSQESEYRASMAMVIGQDGGLLQPSELGQSPEPLTQTVSSLLTSDIVARTVIDKYNLEMTPSHLLSKLDVTSRPESTVLDVNYDSTNRLMSLTVLKGVAQAFPHILQTRLATGTSAQNASPVLSVTVFDPPRLEAEAVSPQPVRNMVIAGALGLLVGVALALARTALTRADEENY